MGCAYLIIFLPFLYISTLTANNIPYKPITITRLYGIDVSEDLRKTISKALCDHQIEWIDLADKKNDPNACINKTKPHHISEMSENERIEFEKSFHEIYPIKIKERCCKEKFIEKIEILFERKRKYDPISSKDSIDITVDKKYRTVIFLAKAGSDTIIFANTIMEAMNKNGWRLSKLGRHFFPEKDFKQHLTQLHEKLNNIDTLRNPITLVVNDSIYTFHEKNRQNASHFKLLYASKKNKKNKNKKKKRLTKKLLAQLER